MSKTIENLRYKNSKVYFKDIVIEFDNNGSAILDDEYADSIVSLPGFSFASEKSKSEKLQVKVNEEKSFEKSDNKDFNDMTVKQLLRYANSNNIDLKGATKKEEIIKVLLEVE